MQHIHGYGTTWIVIFGKYIYREDNSAELNLDNIFYSNISQNTAVSSGYVALAVRPSVGSSCDLLLPCFCRGEV